MLQNIYQNPASPITFIFRKNFSEKGNTPLIKIHKDMKFSEILWFTLRSSFQISSQQLSRDEEHYWA